MTLKFRSTLRGLLQALNRLLTLAAIIMIISAATWTSAAQAQASGAEGWTQGGGSTRYASAYDACEAQWKSVGMHNNPGRGSRLLPPKPYTNDFSKVTCQWTRFQYLCPAETGLGVSGCGTVIPGNAELRCSSGYTPTADGHCRQNPSTEKDLRCDRNPTVGNPIILSTGAKKLESLDYASADGRFRIGRHYRSFQVGRPIQGTTLPRSLPRGLAGGWNFDFGYEIQLGAFSGTPAAPSGKLAVLLPNGTGYGFVLQSNGQWLPDPAAGAANSPTDLKLEFVGTLPADLATLHSSSNTWKLTDGDDTVWTIQTFTSPNGGGYNFGWPVHKKERDGYAATFTYNADSSLASITDSFGRTANFSWYQFFLSSLASPPAGVLPYPQAVSAVTLPDGTSLRFTYDPPPAVTRPSTRPIRKLIKVERLNAAGTVIASESYLHEDARFATHPTGVLDSSGARISSYAYDDLGRATSTKGANETNAYSIIYGTNGTAQTRRVTGPLGKSATYTFTAFSGGPADYRLTNVAAEVGATTPACAHSIGYGTDTFVASQTDFEGRTTNIIRDARDRPISITEGVGTPAARTTTIIWHPTLNAPATISRPGLTESFTYNTIGQLETRTQTDTTSHSAPYATNGQTRIFSFSWTPVGRLLSTNGPLAPDAQGRDDVTSYTYDTSGNLMTSTNALGQITTFGAYDAGGRPGTMTDANNVVTALGYDALGRLLSLNVKHPSNMTLDAVTTFGYDTVGRVTSMALPSTETLQMDYDVMGRLIALRASSGGERIDYSYDKAGNVLSQTLKRGNGTAARRLTRVFDELGRTIRETTGPGQVTKMAYDKVGNAVQAISPNGHATMAAFDALDRVVQAVAPDAGTTALAYDAQDNLVSYSDPVAVTTTFVRNGFGEVIREVSPDRGSSLYYYDAAGAMSAAIDGRGQRTDYARDVLGRMTSATPEGRPASEVIAYSYDTGGFGSYQIGRLAKVTDGTGETRFEFDHRGNMLQRSQSLGSTTNANLAYTYDLADRIASVRYPSGREVRYNRDSKGRVSGVETRGSSTSPWVGLASSLSYDPFGPVASMVLGNGLDVANDRGIDGRLSARRLTRMATGAKLSDLTYRYDPDGNIGGIDDAVVPERSALYGYDSAGRLAMTVAEGAATAQTYNTTTGTNRLASITSPAGTRSIAYDGRGNPATEARPGGLAVTTAYDGHGRLTSYARTGEANLTHAYNGMDDRVATTSVSTSGTDTRRFVYAPDGRVLGEYGANASDVKAEFIWLSPEVGEADASAFDGDDGLGGYIPLAVAANDNQSVSQLTWVHGNHMGVPAVITDTSGTEISFPTGYALPGFPGQSRTLADLYYNRHRDYDPTTGRYIQADPIGLDGGTNPYSYAMNNPLLYTDPDGLQVRPPPRPQTARPRGPDGRFLPANPIPRRPAPQYRHGEFFLGPPGFRITPSDLARERGQCVPGDNVFTQYGRQAHNNYRDALGGSYRYNAALPSGLRPDAINFRTRIVRELKPDNPRARQRGKTQLQKYLDELEDITGQAWKGILDVYRTPW